MSLVFNRTTIFLAFALSAACAPRPIPMDLAERESFSGGQQIQVLYYGPPDLLVPPGPALMMFGAVGNAIAANMPQSQGQQMVKAYGLEDPIIDVMHRFIPSARAVLSNGIKEEATNRGQEVHLDELTKEFGSGLILDLKTVKWGIFRNPFQTFHYVGYQGRARLIRPSEKKVVWQGVCDLEEKDTDNMPHITEFEANNGALLKDNLAKLAASCADELMKQLAGNKVTR